MQYSKHARTPPAGKCACTMLPRPSNRPPAGCPWRHHMRFCCASCPASATCCPCPPTARRVAPEVLLGGQSCTSAVDLYSYGVVLWEASRQLRCCHQIVVEIVKTAAAAPCMRLCTVAAVQRRAVAAMPCATGVACCCGCRSRLPSRNLPSRNTILWHYSTESQPCRSLPGSSRSAARCACRRCRRSARR